MWWSERATKRFASLGIRRNLVREPPFRDRSNLTTEDLEKQTSGLRFMQLKVEELIGSAPVRR